MNEKINLEEFSSECPISSLLSFYNSVEYTSILLSCKTSKALELGHSEPNS